MPAVLVSDADIEAWLGIASGAGGALLTGLVTAAQRMLERHCDRARLPFVDAQTTRTEVRDGTGDAGIFLDYPISTIASITLGRDTASPIETLAPASVDSVVFTVGDRLVRRVDGGIFGAMDAPNYVHVTYAAQADLPEDAAVAVKRAVASVWRQRGSEGSASELVSGYTRQMAEFAATDSFWLGAIRDHARGVFR
jgi:hypothetical protein